MFPGILPKDKGFIVKQNNANHGKNKKKFSTASSQYSSSPSEKSQVHLKNYNFTLPSVAVWQDLNELELSEGTKQQTQRKKIRKAKKSTEEPFIQTQDQEKMKRNNAFKKEGSFIRPSEVTLNHSILLPLSRASVRLQPLKNAPIPNIDEKNGSIMFSSVRERTKVFLPEKSMIIEKMFDDQAVSFKSPPGCREHTELIPEPPFTLEENYRSDGEVDEMDLSSTIFESKTQKAIEKTEKFFPAIDQIASNSKNVEPSVEHNKIDAKTELEISHSSFPSINTSTNEKAPSDSITVVSNKPKGPTLPIFKLSQDSSKKTARYSLKSRALLSKRNLNAEKNKNEVYPDRKKFVRNSTTKTVPLKNGNNFTVGNVRTAKSKFEKKDQKRLLTDQKKTTRRRESTESRNIKPAISEPLEQALPNISDMNQSVCHAENIDEEEQGMESCGLEEQDEVKSMDISEEIEELGSSKLRSSFDLIVDEPTPARVKSPKVLEYPIQFMSKNRKEFLQKKREEFRKIDIDGDGHLSLFEITKCFPNSLSRQQVDYLKMIYQKACSSTFFGLEEFLCVDEMCNVMTEMGDDLKAFYSQSSLRVAQERLDTFLVKFAEAYESSSGLAVLHKLLKRADRGRAGSSVNEVLKLFKKIGKLLAKNKATSIHTKDLQYHAIEIYMKLNGPNPNFDLSLGFGKADFLLIIPVLIEEGWDPEDLST